VIINLIYLLFLSPLLLLLAYLGQEKKENILSLLLKIKTKTKKIKVGMDFIHFVDVFSFFLTIAPHQASQRPCGDPYRA